MDTSAWLRQSADPQAGMGAVPVSGSPSSSVGTGAPSDFGTTAPPPNTGIPPGMLGDASLLPGNMMQQQQQNQGQAQGQNQGQGPSE